MGKKLYFTRLKNVNVASGQFVFKTHGIDVAWSESTDEIEEQVEI